jgi:hypothetical protein
MVPMTARPWLAFLLLGLLNSAFAHADEVKQEGEKEVDTQFIFGFTAGADVGELGEKELEHQTVAQLGKRQGTYAALFDQMRAEFVPVANFRFEIGIPAAFHDIAGVTGLDDRRQGAFDGLSTELRYRLLDREHAPFALTLSAEPHWSRVDETSGDPVDNYGGELSIAADKELIKNRVFAALNLVYDPEVTRSHIAGRWQQEGNLGVLTSVTMQVRPGFFLGAEARYLSKYEGLGLSAFAGEAVFFGPTMFARFAKSCAISGSWGLQVAGHAADAPGALDLTNFTRQQALLRLEYDF